MSLRRCDICGKEYPLSKLYYCKNCEIWFCYSCAEKGWLGGVKCPRCYKEVKQQK